MIDRKNFGLIAACTLIIVAPLLNWKIFGGFDTTFHVGRFFSIAQDFPNQFPVYVYDDWLFGFGEATGIFYPSLLIHPFALLLRIGIPINVAYNLLFATIFVSMAILSFIAFKKFFNEDRLATIATILYVGNWYNLHELYTVTAIGQISAAAFVPLALISSKCMLKNFNSDKNSWIIAILAYTGIIESHVLSSFIFVLGLGICFTIEVIRQRSLDILDWKIFCKVSIATLALNAIFIVPFLISYSTIDININGMSSNSKFDSLLAGNNPWKFFSSEFRHTFGIAGILSLGIFLLTLIRRIDFDRRKIFMRSFSLAILILWMATDLFPWNFIESIPGFYRIDIVQFPHRFLEFGTIFFAVSSAIAIEFIGRNRWNFIAIICIAMTLFSIKPFLNHDRWNPAPQSLEVTYHDYIYRGIHTEDVERWNDIWNSGFEPRVLNIDHRNGKIFVNYDLSKSESNLEGNSKIELPIFYFPGHVANVPIESSERHLIQIDPSNLELHGTIEIFYEGLPSFKIANIISLATLIFLLVKIRREGF